MDFRLRGMMRVMRGYVVMLAIMIIALLLFAIILERYNSKIGSVLIVL
jgi:hypothetical protein